MYELQTRDVCLMGPVCPLFLRRPSSFPLFLAKEHHTPSGPTPSHQRSLHPTNVSDIPRLGSSISPLDGSWMYLFFGDMKDNPRVKGMGLIFISFSFGRILFLLGEWRERLIKISREIIHCREGVDAMGSVCAFIPMIGRRVKHRLVHQGDVSILRLLRVPSVQIRKGKIGELSVWEAD